MQTMNLDNDMLAALAEGVDRLEDGDPGQNLAAERVRIRMIREAGLILAHGQWVPASRATSGYVKPDVYASQIADGRWYVQGYEHPQELAPGQVLYFDIACIVPMRTIGEDDRVADRERQDALEEMTREKIDRERAEVYDYNHRER